MSSGSGVSRLPSSFHRGAGHPVALTIPGYRAASPLPSPFGGRHPVVSARTAPGFGLAGKATPPERPIKAYARDESRLYDCRFADESLVETR